jgi:hypothetical protein
MAEFPIIGPVLTRALGPERAALAQEFLRFGVVGGIGFVVDTAVLYGALALGAGLYLGRAISYIAAATASGPSAGAAAGRRGGNGRCSSWSISAASS